jgi:kumamolisin
VNPKLSSAKGWSSMGAAVRKAYANGANAISISLGDCGTTSGYKKMSSALSYVYKHSVSVFVSSGDSGDRPGPAKDCGTGIGVAYPASDPSVVSVGGTSLDLNLDGSIAQETAWSHSGGGVVRNMLRPVWQSAPQLPTGNKRWVPDVAFVGNPKTGVDVAYKGAWHVFGGTSVGAPAWAGIWTLVLQQAGQAIGPAPDVIYGVANSASYSTSFNDIVLGSNGKYQAGVGWDAVTGWGTPDVANLITSIQNPQTGSATP